MKTATDGVAASGRKVLASRTGIEHVLPP